MIRHDMPQRSPEWYQIRCGKLTASDAKDMLATIKTGEAAARRELRARLVAERLTCRPQEDGYVSADMQRGIDSEASARACYEATRGVLVESVGFLEHDTLAAGCSPDGLVDGGIVEIKCPKTATHLGYLRDPLTLVAAYRAQLTHALWVSEAPWIDIVSYDDRLPDRLRLRCVRMARSLRGHDLNVYSLAGGTLIEMTDDALAAHDAAARAFLAEVDRDVATWLGWGVMEATV